MNNVYTLQRVICNQPQVSSYLTSYNLICCYILLQVNILLQAYMSYCTVEGSALVSEMGFIAQCAARIMRALYKIVTYRGWTELSTKADDFCNIIDRKMYVIPTWCK